MISGRNGSCPHTVRRSSWSSGETNDRNLVDWGVVANPAPLGFDMDEYIPVRAEATRNSFVRACGVECLDVDAVLRDSMRGVEGAHLPSRSAPISEADVAAAALAIPYQDKRTARALALAIVQSKDVELIGRASDLVWSRYGEGELSMGHLAYLDEVCPAFPGPLPGARDVVSDALVVFHAPCALFPKVRAPLVLSVSPLCVASLENDAVAPREFAMSWSDRATVNIVLAGDDHSLLTGFVNCIERLDL